MNNSSAIPPPEPSGEAIHRQALVEAAELLAKVLDTTVKIPGTSLYLGLDPLIGLIPGIGDVLANLIGTVILGMAARLEVPRIVIARMSLNLLINGAIGAIPILGDLFSVWFRSNSRNADLLRQAATQAARGTHADWSYVVGIIAGTVGLLLGLVAFVLWVAVSLWSRFAGIQQSESRAGHNRSCPWFLLASMVHLERFTQGGAMNGSGCVQPSATEESTTQGTVLVVDDDAAVCHVTGQMLEMHGYRVLYAENGEQAMALLDENSDEISILVADIVMPKMSGPQLAHLLRIQRPELPVLFVSGLVSYSNFEGVMGGWMLKKPYSPSMLASKVRDVLATFGSKSEMAS